MRVDRQKLRKNASLLVLEKPFRTKWWSFVKNWGKLRFFFAGLVPEQPFRTKWGSMRKNQGKIAILLLPDLSRSNPFAGNEDRSSKTEVKLRFYFCRSNPFARNEGRSSKTDVKLRVYLSWSNPFARNDGRSSKTEENRDFSCAGLVPEQPFRTKWRSIGRN